MNMDMIAISESINSHLYHSFNNLELIQGGRILIAIAALISFCLIVYLLRNENKSFLYFFAFLFAVSGALVIQSWVLHPDSAAVLFWILFIVFYLFSFRLESHKSILTLATLFAFLAASKFTYVLFSPLLLLSLLVMNVNGIGWRVTIKQIGKFILVTGIILIALFPFVWTDSLTFAKGFFGNIFMKSSGPGDSLNILVFDYLPSLITYPGIILSVIGLMLSFRNLGNSKALLLILTFLLFAYPIANASQTYERYSLSLLPMLLIWSSFGFEFILRKIKNPMFAKVSATVIILLCVTQSAKTISKEFQTYHGSSNFASCRMWLIQNIKANEKIALPVSFEHYMYENKNCIERIISRNSDPALITSKLQSQIKQKYKNKPLNVKGVILENLFLDEKTYLDHKYRVKYDFVTSSSNESCLYDIFYYTEKEFTSLHCYKFDEVENNKNVKYLLTENRESENGTLLIKFNEFNGTPYYLYSINQ
jgi:hypothetical protein